MSKSFVTLYRTPVCPDVGRSEKLAADFLHVFVALWGKFLDFKVQEMFQIGSKNLSLS